MKRSWTALAVALAAVFAVVGCNDYGTHSKCPPEERSVRCPGECYGGKRAVHANCVGGRICGQDCCAVEQSNDRHRGHDRHQR